MPIVPLCRDDSKRLEQYASIASLDDVVKELIENGIDAHATSIDVHLRLSNTFSIWCQDNGDGISEEDLAVAGLPFHTSKLGGQATMGFRGSALCCISSLCSECKIISRRKDTFSLRLRNGERELKPYAESFPKGTLVVLSNIFAQLPIRRKYTSSIPHNSLMLAIKKAVFHISINIPSVRIRVFDLSDNRILFDCSDALSLLNIRLVDRKEFKQGMEQFEIDAVMGNSQQRGIRSIYINSRRFVNQTVYRRLDRRFGGKTCFSYVFRVFCDVSAIELAQDPSKVVYRTEYDKEIETVCGLFIDEFLRKERSKVVMLSPKRRKKLQSISPFFPSAVTAKFKATSFADAQIISQVDGKYILAKVNTSYRGQRASSLVILDQHACDERIKVESLRLEFLKTCHQNALCNGEVICIAVSPEEGLLLVEFQKHFAQWGILYHVDCQLEVSALPGILSQKREVIKTSLLEHCFEMKEKPAPLTSCLARVGEIPRVIMDLLNSKACRSAVKFGDILGLDECNRIVRELSKCKQPFNCAHGRPLMFPLADLGGKKVDIDYE